MLQCYLLWIFVSIRRLIQLIVCIGVSTAPHYKTAPPSFAKSPLKSANYSSPSFLGDSPSCPPPLSTPTKKKNRIFQWTPIILKKSLLTLSHLLKVTKFLVEIFQFKFLVMTEIFFCHEMFQILIYFSCKNCNPMKKVTPFPPFLFFYCLSRNTLFINLLLLW